MLANGEGFLHKACSTVAGNDGGFEQECTNPGGTFSRRTVDWPASGTSNNNRLSKPPQRASVIITTIQEERERERGDFVQLMDVESTKSAEAHIGVAK